MSRFTSVLVVIVVAGVLLAALVYLGHLIRMVAIPVTPWSLRVILYLAYLILAIALWSYLTYRLARYFERKLLDKYTVHIRGEQD